eukprot:14818459-Alexandrium_andersonii.AAC.1
MCLNAGRLPRLALTLGSERRMARTSHSLLAQGRWTATFLPPLVLRAETFAEAQRSKQHVKHLAWLEHS